MRRTVWNVCMAGAAGVGKTSLVRRYVENIFIHEFMPTFGVEIRKKSIQFRGEQVDLILWDLAGDDEFLLSKDLGATSLQNKRTAAADAYILVADSSRKTTLEQAITRQQRIVQDRIIKHETRAPFVLALNKSDVQQKEIGESDVRESVPAWTVIPTSAKTGDGVERMFETVVAMILSQKDDDE